MKGPLNDNTIVITERSDMRDTRLSSEQMTVELTTTTRFTAQRLN
jgi:hypothetical protein